jgi:hypothetical protein
MIPLKLEFFTQFKRQMDQVEYLHLELFVVVAFVVALVVQPLAYLALVPSLDAFEVVVAFLAAKEIYNKKIPSILI